MSGGVDSLLNQAVCRSSWFEITVAGLRRHPAWLLWLLLLSAMAVSSTLGAVAVTLDGWLSLLSFDGLYGQGQVAQSHYVLLNLRLPRVLFAALIGAVLGLSGALTQGLFRNPLADPGLLGITGGAACAAALTIVLVGSSGLNVPPALRYWMVPLAAFGGAVVVCLLLDRVARWLTANSIAGLLLTGIALNALTAAVIGLCTYIATDEQLRTLSFWTLGSLAGGTWMVVGVLALLTLFGWWMVRKLLHVMNGLALGEAAAEHIGIDVRQLRQRVVILVALMSGFAVAWCGMIGFVALIAPHLVRTAIGPDQRQVVPLSMLVGAILLLIADTCARIVAIPAEVPVGIFTSLVGAPFFLMMLRGIRG